VAATPGENLDGFLVAVYLTSLLSDNYFEKIKTLPFGGPRWSEKLIDQLVDGGMIEPPEDGYFFDASEIIITEKGKEKALELIKEPGARVPEIVLFGWRYNYLEKPYNLDENGDPAFIPAEISDRLRELEDGYRRYKNDADQYKNREMERNSDAVGIDGGAATAEAISAQSWTGVPSEQERIKNIKILIVPAIAVLDKLIEELESGKNNGPRIQENIDRLKYLKRLHSALGELLARSEAGRLGSDLGEGLASEAVALCGRLKREFKHDPLRWSLMGLVGAVAASFGDPSISLGAAFDMLKAAKNKH
jgi:hypothetical protein